MTEAGAGSTASCETGEALFRSGEWSVAVEGLEHGPTGYFIERGALAARRADGHWEWPLHLAEKRWCAPHAFREAFLEALRLFKIDADPDLALSFAAAGSGREARTAQPADDRFVRLGELCRDARSGRAVPRRSVERARAVAPDAPRRRAVPAVLAGA